jgi:hypothetical protein
MFRLKLEAISAVGGRDDVSRWSCRVCDTHF